MEEVRIYNQFKVRIIKTQFLNFNNYCYLGIDLQSKQAFIVDPAWELRKIEQCIEEEQATLTMVLLTHAHFDHVNLAGTIARKYNVPVYIGEMEKEHYRFHCRGSRGVRDGERIEIGNTFIQCISTPGHTKGGISYLCNGHFFTGDTLFIEGCGVCNMNGGSAEQMYETFQRLRNEISGDTYVYPGHRYKNEPGQRMEFVLEHNIYFKLLDKEYFIEFRNRPRKVKNRRGL